MASSDPMKRAAERIAIDYPVKILRMPGGGSVTRMLTSDAGDTRTGSSSSQGPKGGQSAPGGGRVKGKGKKPGRVRRPVRQGFRSQLPGFMDPGNADGFGQGFEDVDTSPPTDRHVLDNGICVTCKMREQMSEPHVFDNGVCVTCGDAGPKGLASRHLSGLHDEEVQVLLDALDEVLRTRYVRTPAGAKKYGLPIGSPIGGDHGPHVPKPAPGKKGTLKDRLVSAITEHLDGKGDGKPLAGFNREQLRQAAKSRGIKLDRGEHEDSIAEKLIAHARGDHNDSPKPDTPEPAKPPVKKVAKKATRPVSSRRALIGDDALNAPPLRLADLPESDPRAAALWYRTGDNSLDTPDGMPGFVGMNAVMRGEGYGDDAMRRRIADIDRAMGDSKLREPIEVYRGMDTYAIGTPGQLKGVEFSDGAFVSTTTDRAHARSFSSTIVRVRVPAGTGAVRMADRDPDLVESEILLDRDLKYRVVDEIVERDERGRIVSHELVVEVVP